ncbi:SAP domain-containing protein [Rhodotorula paludigena]|uniref:SAP domain-containing protein n=1 Tax=Rhodotorula paludigena TaxID=86838 RepID=UPI003179D1A7
MDPSEAILSNDAALHSLKRQQLLALCKQFGLKGSGKNVELIERLQEHGRFLARSAQQGEVLVETDADASTASWAVVADGAVPEQQEVLAEFGVQAHSGSSPSRDSTLSGSASSGSISSTLRSAGATLLRALVDPAKPAVVSPAPSAPLLSQQAASSADMIAHEVHGDYQDALGEDEDGGIRLVSSRSTIPDSSFASTGEDIEPALPIPVSSSAAFVFGSPPPATSASTMTAPPSSFTFSMPGTLFASTSSTTSTEAAPPPSAAESIMEEMNRRAAAMRVAAGGSGGVSRSGSMLFGSSTSSSIAKGAAASPSKGSKAAFDAAHRRNFDKQDSITSHWAAKRPHPSSSNIAGLARTGSSRTLVADAAAPEPARKRLKPSSSRPMALNRLASSSSSGSSSASSAADKKLVSALRDQGWSAAPAATTAVSLSSSIRGAGSVGPKGKSKEVREDLKPGAEVERAQKKRQLELAKARRKSQIANGAGMSRRRPSLGVGPKPTGSAASRLLKSTFRKFAPPSNKPTTLSRPPLPSSASSRNLASTASTIPSSSTTSSSASVPRFAAPTASTSSRAALASTSTASPPKKAAQPGWKKFDLQASLQRPMSWKPHLGASPQLATSPSSARPSAAFAAPASASKRASTFTRTASSMRVANATLFSPVRAVEPPAPEQATSAAQDKLAALPPAPSTAPAPLQALTNIGPVTASSAASGSWLPPAVTKKPLLPSSPAAPSAKKLVSSSSRAARSGDKARSKAQIEGLESRARKVRASQAAMAVAKGKGKAKAPV